LTTAIITPTLSVESRGIFYNFEEGEFFMIDKNELLSIGETAKLTGVGIRALHYYERINILKPAYIDPDSGYRYYTYDQAKLTTIISDCVELDIPLKELSGLFETDDFDLLRKFFIRNKEAAEKKLETIKTTLALADKALKRMEVNKKYKICQMYKKEVPEKTYYVKPFGNYIDNRNRIKQQLEMQKEILTKLDPLSIDESELVLMESGLLCTHSPKGIEYYDFFELPKSLAHIGTLTIVSGSYFFRQDRNTNIENSLNIFVQHLRDCDNFMFVEVEVLMTGKTKIYEPIHELRLIPRIMKS
jgi:DNA-binding transcriptional MerR regulator